MSDIFDSFFDDSEPLPTLSRQEAFGLLNQVIPKRSSLVALRCVKVTGADGYLTLEGTDLDYGVKVRIANGSKPFEGVAVINWQDFQAKFGLVAIGDMDSMDVSDYPHIPGPTGAEVGDNWIPAAKKVVYCVSADPDRLTLAGVYCTKDAVVATDGHRLHLVKGAYDIDAIVPPKMLKLLKDGATKVLQGAETLGAVYPWGHVVSKVIEGPYPNYRQVIPATSNIKFQVPLAALLSAAKKATELRKDGGRVSMHRKGIWAMDTDGKWHPMSSLPTLPEDVVCQLNASYTIESLKGLVGAVTIGYRSSTQAMVLNPDSQEETRILMPLRPEGVES